MHAQLQEIKIKVNMHSEKCRKGVMKAVTKLSGVDQVTVDLPKEMLVVIGDVDPVCVATCLRKKRWVAQIVSVGPKKEKEKDENKLFPMMYCNAPYDYGYGYGYYPVYRSIE
ncbi:putative heavy metal-associated domain, HMA, heavy metal-associated domain superfamily [Helianthus annuus]|nr:putative heavy metal-associated domain, HMA, heavy metal-associated domain superfamily [Helianthus annuus]KAJ0596833.1 putative heavy metal-associated domain, HMA, heavy metal-associated domain superfamily [Helianthus annuus]KAJ0757512.1 putative heavy metal-associated domain, HMA, heavy metal-associated domain superfamily [Helianthus annuus]KAJ0761200.1 putative heavy metal-associated domain, HMA, heavy metal-associated domain superfamily [Helianthus annuus]KAJ0796251.1 putative heavy metal